MVTIGGWLNTALLGRGGHHRGLTQILTVYPCQNIAASASLQSPTMSCVLVVSWLVTTSAVVAGVVAAVLM